MAVLDTRLTIRLPDFTAIKDSVLRGCLNELVRALQYILDYVQTPRTTVFSRYSETNVTVPIEITLAFLDATSNNVTVTLTPSERLKGRHLEFKRTDASGNTVTLTGGGVEFPISLGARGYQRLFCDGNTFWKC